MENAVALLEEWASKVNDDSKTDGLTNHIGSNLDEERLLHAFFTVSDERTKFTNIFDATTKKLFFLSCSKNQRDREFVLVCAPTLLFIYLSAISLGDKKSVLPIEVILLTLYNTEVLDDYGQPTIPAFRLPTLARHSIYHEPSTIAFASFTQDSLQRVEAADSKTVRWGPPREMSQVTASNRDHLATGLMVTFNSRISQWSRLVLLQLCKVVSKLVSQGFSKPGHIQRGSYGSGNESNILGYPRPTPRIPLTSDMMSELTHAVYFSIHNTLPGWDVCPASYPACLGHCNHSPQVRYRRLNEFASPSIKALEDIHMRAQYELYADVLLMTNAVKNSLKINPKGQTIDSSMLNTTSVSSMLATTSSPLNKSFITNASFRTKKLPDDIEVVVRHEKSSGSQDAKGLGSICEEGNSTTEGGGEKDNKPIRPIQGSGRENKLRMPSNLVMAKKKEKMKNGGDKKDSGDKKTDKKKEKEKEKEMAKKDVESSNRNSSILNNSDSEDITGGSHFVPQYIQREHFASRRDHHSRPEDKISIEKMTITTNEGKSTFYDKISPDKLNMQSLNHDSNYESISQRNCESVESVGLAELNGSQNNIER